MAEGIDVARYQGRPDWQKVKDAGIEFAWLKASGSGKEALHVDPTFEYNFQETRGLDIHSGGYHFWLGGQVTPRRQIQHFYAQVGDLQAGDLVPMLDFEDPPGGKLILTRSDLHIAVTESEQLFQCSPAIYAGESLWRDFAWFEQETYGCPRVIPNWSRTPSIRYDVHQYTDKGRIPGIAGYVDRDRTTNLQSILFKGADMALTDKQYQTIVEILEGVNTIKDRALNAAGQAALAVQIATLHSNSSRTRHARTAGDPYSPHYVVTDTGKWWIPTYDLYVNLRNNTGIPLEEWSQKDIDDYPTLPWSKIPNTVDMQGFRLKAQEAQEAEDQ